jgi:UDP:flavonoid glycosyltransferase YjiC (YdhE family)
VKRPTVAIAVTGHGYGHAVRAAQVAYALVARGARVLMRTEAPRWLFPPEAEWLESPGWPIDIGVVQHDGLDMDIDATRAAWRELARDFEARAEVEARLLREADVLLGDIPPLAFEAAARAGVPSYGMTNFTWNWIYAAWPEFDDIVARITRSYAHARVLFRLPLHSQTLDAFAGFSRIEDVPLVARKATRSREDVRRQYGLPLDATVVLLSFGGFTARGLDLMRLADWNQYQFVVTPPMSAAVERLPANARRLNPPAVEYVSLLAACDVVVTKPGYGIVADCLANRVAVLFTDRGPFREYDVLAEALPRLGRARFVPREDVLRGELRPHLEAVLAQQTRWTEQPMNGAQLVAERLLQSATIELESQSEKVS